MEPPDGPCRIEESVVRLLWRICLSGDVADGLLRLTVNQYVAGSIPAAGAIVPSLVLVQSD